MLSSHLPYTFVVLFSYLYLLRWRLIFEFGTYCGALEIISIDILYTRPPRFDYINLFFFHIQLLRTEFVNIFLYLFNKTEKIYKSIIYYVQFPVYSSVSFHGTISGSVDHPIMMSLIVFLTLIKLARSVSRNGGRSADFE